MTHKAPASRAVDLKALTRVEGEGGLYVETAGGKVTDVQLRIYEPPRFFEAFLRGRSYLEPPDITARICGICPVAYQMSACLAIEDACDVTVDGPLDALRRLIYCGEWIESHTLHVYLLHAPDFLGLASAIELAALDRPAVDRGLRLKKTGNELIELIGGRAIHPINVRVGGFHRVPTRRELRRWREPLQRALDDALSTVEWVAGFEFPARRMESAFVAVGDPGHYPIMGGGVRSDTGVDIVESAFLDRVTETQVAHSTALHASLDGDEYLVGPLARYALGHDRLAPVAREAARAAKLGEVERNPFRSIVVRAVEVVHACAEALRIIDEYEEPDQPAVEVLPRAGVGHGCTEAPRGLLYHRYELDADGTIVDARIVPPTSQNQPAIEHDVWHVVEDNLQLDDGALSRLAEQTIRNHDPCISCATHFLDFRRVDR
jgi:coenzyme F420-reducing hydrogenase alpha subunit